MIYWAAMILGSYSRTSSPTNPSGDEYLIVSGGGLAGTGKASYTGGQRRQPRQ